MTLTSERKRADQLQTGDKIWVTVMGGEDYREITAVEPSENGKIAVTSKWGWHVPVSGTITDEFEADYKFRMWPY